MFCRSFFMNIVCNTKAKLADEENAFKKVFTCYFSL